MAVEKRHSVEMLVTQMIDDANGFADRMNSAGVPSQHSVVVHSEVTHADEIMAVASGGIAVQTG
jgi:hypothetical protein